jgi:hypothetical protein
VAGYDGLAGHKYEHGYIDDNDATMLYGNEGKIDSADDQYSTHYIPEMRDIGQQLDEVSNQEEELQPHEWEAYDEVIAKLQKINDKLVESVSAKKDGETMRQWYDRSINEARRLINENSKQTKSADTGGAQEGDGTGGAQDGSGSDENTGIESPLLKSYTNAEAVALEAAKAKAKKEAETEPAAPKVSADQTDMFNGQDSLFNSNREQSESRSPLDTTDKSWVIKNKQTVEVMFETFDREKVKALNTDKYVAVPITEHLASLNKPAESSTAQDVKSIKALRAELESAVENRAFDRDAVWNASQALRKAVVSEVQKRLDVGTL